MIVTCPGVSRTVADAAGASLDTQIARLRAEGKLEAGKENFEKLQWTTETIKTAREFAETVYFIQMPSCFLY